MKNPLHLHEKIEKFRMAFQGVFTLSDLKNLLPAANPVDFYRQLKVLEENEILLSFTRGLYVCPGFDLATVSQRLCSRSYVSLANVLAKEMLIGTVPNNTVYAIKTGKSRTYKSPFGTVIHLGISPRLFFGFQTRNGLNYANKEKAVLDTLYFYQKGLKLYFNIYQDLNVESLDRDVIKKYLKTYKNPRFITFAKGVLNG